MYRLISKVNIGKYEFDYLTELMMSSSWQHLTDTVKLTIPKRLRFQGNNITQGDNSLFKIGDAVKIQIGYYPTLTTVFTGYLADIALKTPLELTIQDRMWIFKQVGFTKAWKSITLKNLVNFLVDEVKKSKYYVPFDVNVTMDTTFTDLRVTAKSPAEVLELLRKEYGVQSYFKDGNLHVGLAYEAQNDTQDANTQGFTFGVDVISDDLTYKNKENMKVHIKGVSVQKDNKKVEVELGDFEGQPVNVNIPGLSQADLKKYCEELLGKLKYDGFTGSFETFGHHGQINQGDAIRLTDPKITERNGKYLVKSVETSFGVSNGYKQKITLERKIS